MDISIRLQWGRDREVADRAHRRGSPPASPARFNGAATARSRIGRAGGVQRFTPKQLQWGRDREVADRVSPGMLC